MSNDFSIKNITSKLVDTMGSSDPKKAKKEVPPDAFYGNLLMVQNSARFAAVDSSSTASTNANN